ncbi:MAG: RimJ/RimL family protein N-acetyltransferase [Bacteriovoracaceae bacterium]|jgi:RimJ/RimL family protein N-acetyltransferase
MLKVKGEKIFLRELCKDDASDEYLSWLNDSETTAFLETKPNQYTKEKLKEYIQEKTEDKDVFFFGIFDLETNTHIGNLKFEPINEELNYSVFGIMLGNKKYRGRGIGSEALKLGIKTLYIERQISRVFLGAKIENTTAINLYKRFGFVDCVEVPFIYDKNTSTVMIYEYKDDQ